MNGLSGELDNKKSLYENIGNVVIVNFSEIILDPSENARALSEVYEKKLFAILSVCKRQIRRICYRDVLLIEKIVYVGESRYNRGYRISKRANKIRGIENNI